VQSPNCGLSLPELLSKDRYYVESFSHTAQCSADWRLGRVIEALLPEVSPIAQAAVSRPFRGL
jgi:hypothetical protein